jgi:lathosterol oxidase
MADYFLSSFKVLFPMVLLEGFLRYVLIVSSLYVIFWMLLASRIKHRLIQKKWPEKKHIRREILFSMSTVLIIAFTGFLVFAAGPAYFRLYTDIALYGWWYFSFSLLCILLAHDTYFYWTHRLMHHPLFFKSFHRLHHLSLNPSPWAAYAFSPWEATLHAAFLPLYLLLVPSHPLVVFLFLYHMVLRNAVHHLGIELFPRGFTRHPFWGWNATTTHHSLHHLQAGSNYGFYFTFWDRLMKTLNRDYDSFYERITQKPLLK